MEFSELQELQRSIATYLDEHTQSLRNYYIPASGGFIHRFDDNISDDPNEFAKTSTATCILSLAARAKWKNGPWNSMTQHLIDLMLKQENWESAGLKPNNPFTLAFLIEATIALQHTLDPINANKLKDDKDFNTAIGILAQTLSSSESDDKLGAVHIEAYPPTTYLTQLVMRVLEKAGYDSLNTSPTSKWAWQQIEHELALHYSGAKSFDALALAYAVMLVFTCSKSSEATPDENSILRKAINTVFEAQLEDGSWPHSRPLFHYPKVGNAYCFEYEMLTQLLQLRNNRDMIEHLLRHLPELALVTRRLDDIAYRFEDGGFGWASGHHPQLTGPESWSTASVFHFLHEIDRTLSEAVRRSVFDYIGVEYSPPTDISTKEEFTENFLDSELQTVEGPQSLRSVLLDNFVDLVKDKEYLIKQGQSLPKDVPISAVFFGPPGTSKTQLARLIAKYLGWPLLIIDPSHLVRKGLDQVQAETNTVFSMLASLERVVVLLDEFDEMVRERTSEQSEIVSRFLTTAMLPKLAQINERRRIVFIVATNHIDEFDFAIRRPGRFDLLIQIMPPSAKEKLRKWPEVNDLFSKIGIDPLHQKKIARQIDELTYLEFEQLVPDLLSSDDNPIKILELIELQHQRSTLMQEISPQDSKTWSDVCQAQARYIRVPNLSSN